MAGRPFPALSEDDYVDFCVVEAMTLKMRERDAEAARQREIEEWKKRPLGSG